MFQYDERKTKALEAPVDQIQLDAVQERLIRDLATVVGPALGLDTIPCLGLWLRAVRAWQIAHKRPATSISMLDPPGRARAAGQMRDCFVELAKEMLRSPEQGAALARAVEEAFDMYMKRYNQRPR